MCNESVSKSFLGNGDDLTMAELRRSGGVYHCLTEPLIDLCLLVGEGLNSSIVLPQREHFIMIIICA